MNAPHVSYSSSYAASLASGILRNLPNGDVLRSGWFIVNKFGNNPNIGTATDPMDVWDGPSLGATSLYTFSSTNDIDSISSSNGGDGQDVEIQGLDVNWDRVVQTVTLNGQTRVALTTPLLRVFRMINLGTTDFAGNIYCYVNTAIAGGVPVDLTKVRSVIRIGYNQTLMAIYSTMRNYNTYLLGYFIGVGNAAVAGAKEADCSLRIRAFDTVFAVKKTITLNTTGTGATEVFYPVPLSVGEQADILWRCDEVSANNTQIDGGYMILHNPQS